MGSNYISVQVDKSKSKKKEKGKKGNAKNKGKGKGKGKDKKGKKKSKETVPVIPVEKPKHVFEVDKPIGAAHIEYELFPSKSKYQIDVICWGPIAKIFTNDGQIILKTVIKSEKAWVPVCLKHYAENLETEDLKKYQKYVVKFNITSNMKKIGKVAKTDKSKQFFAYINEAELPDFIEVYDQDPNLKEKPSEERRREALEKFMKKIILECANCPKGDFVSWLRYPDKYDIFHDIIQKQCSGLEVEAKDFVLPCPLPVELMKPVKEKSRKKKDGKAKKGKKDKGKKAKNKKPKVSDVVVIQIPSEVFFTDPLLATYKAENDGVITNVFILISVKHLLTTAQKLFLNPLVVKILKLSNVPVNALSNLGIGSIYISYQIPWIANCQSIEKPVKEVIRFNEAHIFFNDTVSKIKLIEFLQTQKLYVEIYGVKNTAAPYIPANIFGNENDDKEFSCLNANKTKTYDTTYNPVLLIAVCTYDVSSLVANIWDFKEKGQCHVPGSTLYQKSVGCYGDITYMDLENVPEMNLISSYVKPKSPLTEDALLSFGTTLKMEVYLMAPQSAPLVLIRTPNLFKRIFMIVFNEDIAKQIISDVLTQNDKFFTKLGEHSDDKDFLENLDIITGFFIDNGSNFAIFLEGQSLGFIMSLWHLTEKCQVEDGKFYFNMDTSFEQRLYHQFLDKGLLQITLKIPLHDILSERRMYLTGNVPLPCMEALKKLCLLCHSFLLKSIFQYGLLPKSAELKSLNLEWGVPIRWKEDRRKSIMAPLRTDLSTSVLK